MKTLTEKPKNDIWDIVLKVIIAIASALLGAIGSQAITV